MRRVRTPAGDGRSDANGPAASLRRVRSDTRSEAATAATPAGLPGPARTLLKVAGSLVAAGAAGVVAYDALAIARLRRDAPRNLVQLDHDGAVGEGVGEPLSLVVLGDSAADGYGNVDVRDAYPHQVASRLSVATGRRVRVSSLAVSGATTQDVVDDQVFQLRGRDADVVVVAVGVNDGIRRNSRREVEAATRTLVERLGAVVPEAEVVLVGTPDLSTAPGIPWPLSSLLGWRCRTVAAVQRRVADELDVPYVGYGDAPQVEMYGPDGFHPGPAGQAAAADLTVDVLMTTMEERTWISG